MLVKDFLKLDVDADITDDVVEELGIAFVGPVELTEQGEEYFHDILDLEVEKWDENNYVLCLDSTGEKWEKYLRKANQLFYGLAGYCSVQFYDKMFK